MKIKIIIPMIILLIMPLTSTAKSVKKIWKIETNTDKMSDVVTKIYIASITKNFSIVLFDEYDDKTIDVMKFFFGKRYLTNSDNGIVQLRFDKEFPESYNATYEKNSVFIEKEYDIKFIFRKMLESKTMLIRVFDYEEKEYDETVILEGLKENIKQFERIQ